MSRKKFTVGVKALYRLGADLVEVSSRHYHLTAPTHISYFSDMKVIDQTQAEARTVAMLRAIAHPARYRIVKLLAARQSCVCGDLVGELPLAQSTVSEHLKVLKDAGIVRGNVDGPNTCYCLEPEALEWLKREFGELRASCC